MRADSSKEKLIAKALRYRSKEQTHSSGAEAQFTRVVTWGLKPPPPKEKARSPLKKKAGARHGRRPLHSQNRSKMRPRHGSAVPASGWRFLFGGGRWVRCRRGSGGRSRLRIWRWGIGRWGIGRRVIGGLFVGLADGFAPVI